jgi:Zn-finger protein
VKDENKICYCFILLCLYCRSGLLGRTNARRQEIENYDVMHPNEVAEIIEENIITDNKNDNNSNNSNPKKENKHINGNEYVVNN